MGTKLRGCRRIAGLLLAMSIAGGCATMSESECINADWREVGRNDGLEGKRQTQLARHYDACIKYGITPDRDEYMAGREAGLIVYCTQDSGYWEGRNGAGYQRVCPGEFGTGVSDRLPRRAIRLRRHRKHPFRPWANGLGESQDRLP